MPATPDASAKRNARPTIKDVARLVGVHFTTVSLALRDHPSIPETTKAKIRKAATKLGYVKNPVFAALSHYHMHGRTRAEAPRVALILNHFTTEDDGLFAYQRAILAGARQQAASLGYEMEELRVGPDYIPPADLDAHLKKLGIRGIVLCALSPDQPLIELNWEDFALIKINTSYLLPQADYVSNDQFQEVRIAHQRLRALGYKRIGLAVGRTDEIATDKRHAAGYLIEQATIPPADRVPELLFPFNPTVPLVSKLLGEWVRKNRIDAVLCNWGNIRFMLGQAGLHVPTDIACACLCLMKEGSSLAGIRPDLFSVGKKSISQLVSLLKAEKFGLPDYHSTTYVHSTWQDGDSAPPRLPL